MFALIGRARRLAATKLVQPLFKLERIGLKLAGSIISETFKGKSARQRQRMIWDALDAEIGAEATHKVGTILTYTLEEWNVDLPKTARVAAV